MQDIIGTILVIFGTLSFIGVLLYICFKASLILGLLIVSGSLALIGAEMVNSS